MPSKRIAHLVTHMQMFTCSSSVSVIGLPLTIGVRIGATFVSNSLIHPSLQFLHTFLTTISGSGLVQVLINPVSVLRIASNSIFLPGHSSISRSNHCGQTCSSELTRPRQKMQILVMEDYTVKKKKQKTSKGAEIPIPKRGDFFKNLKKAASPLTSRRPKK
jgi:hypothetical protein